MSRGPTQPTRTPKKGSCRVSPFFIHKIYGHLSHLHLKILGIHGYSGTIWDEGPDSLGSCWSFDDDDDGDGDGDGDGDDGDGGDGDVMVVVVMVVVVVVVMMMMMMMMCKAQN